MSANSTSRARSPLLVTELFHCVLECLDTTLPEGPGKEERRALAALARTCRTFSEPSLDHLWRRLDSLLPLVRCFANVVDEARVKTLPSPAEWLVINRYSHRIRELTLGSENLFLYFLQRTNLVLPNLKVFRWQCPEICRRISTRWLAFPFRSIPFVWALLTPKIVTLEMTFVDPDDPPFLCFLENFPLLCPNLKSIVIRFFWESPARAIVTEALSRAVSGHADLQCAKIPTPIDVSASKYLGMSSTIRTLSLTGAPQENWFGPGDTPFRNVIDLDLRLLRLEFVTGLLRPRDQVFHNVEVTLISGGATSEVSAFFTEIASPQRTHSLQSIKLRHARNIPFVSGRRLSYETFCPLVSLMHLRELVIEMNTSISLDDDELVGLVRNWPLLEVLQLTSMHGEYPAVSRLVTLGGFLSLLASCRKLREIGLRLDARVIPGEAAYADVCGPSVTHLTVQKDSPIEQPDFVAEFLLKRLPHVSCVNVSFPWHPAAEYKASSEKCCQLWLQVRNRIADHCQSSEKSSRTPSVLHFPYILRSKGELTLEHPK